MHRALAVALLAAAAAGCGPAPDFSKAATRIGVLTGGLDPTLVGTFRLFEKRTPDKGMFTLLVLRTDLSFYGQYVASCHEEPCEGIVEIEGTYRQKRELPNLSRASKVTLTGTYVDPETGVEMGLFMTLIRGWVEGSPQISLFHLQEGEGELMVPFFELTHPFEKWCATPEDCELQETENECTAFSCAESLCKCR
jgi:hypothetical protein